MDESNLTPSKIAENGKNLYKQEDYAQAAELFAMAARGFEESGEPINAAEMANNCSVSLLQNGDSEAALAAVGETDRVFAEYGDTRRQAMALGNRAAALAALGRREEAEKTYWESAHLLGEIGERDLRASVLQAISKLQLKEGRYGEALASMDSSLEGSGKVSIPKRLLRRLIKFPMKLLGRGS
jgi:tetratricopeptide (TPR) repeat protein